MTARQETAARLDSAIDSLLREDRHLSIAGAEGDLVATARLLRDALPRFHPRFGFEELLAGRLATPPARSGEPIPFPSAAAARSSVIEEARLSGRRRRGLVAGGAIASGVSIAIPLAGAALVVWRRGRSSGGLL